MLGLKMMVAFEGLSNFLWMIGSVQVKCNPRMHLYAFGYSLLVACWVSKT